MKLAALGAVTMVIGLVLTEPGLVAVGALWVVVGILVRRHAAWLTGPTTADARTVAGGRTFATGMLLWLVLGLPSLMIGLLSAGISPEHDGWRWLPLVVGVAALGVGVLAGTLWLLGSAVGAVADGRAQPTSPATLRIRAMRETGTFINERPRLQLDLTVEPDPGTGLAPYEVTKSATVPYTALGSLVVGGGFRALVAGPDEPTAMTIHWDQPVRSP